MMNIFETILFSYLTIVSGAKFDLHLKCMHTSQWKHRATAICQRNDVYHCLYDVNIMRWREECFHPEDLPPGYHSVLSGQLHATQCADNHFSPYISWSNEGSECQYQKHVCSDEGQIEVDNGSNVRDIQCRCDYRKGYAFVIKPKDECTCSPSVEDCSCYKTKCHNNSLILSQDYICTHSDHISAFTKCQKIKKSCENNSHENKTGEIIQFSVIGLHRRILRVSSIIGFVLVCLIGSYFCYKVFYISNESLGEKHEHLLQTVKNLSKFSELKNKMNKTSVLILKGRQGTGKTTLAKCFRELYSGKRCKIIDLRMDMPNINYNIIDSHENITVFENEIEPCLSNKKGTQFIIVVETIPKRFNTFLKKINKDPADVVDLDTTEFYNATDRGNILKIHMKMKNIHFEDDLKQFKSIDASKPISIGTSLFNDILSSDTLLGFPSMCALLCSHSDHIKLGMKYVKQPPSTLVEMFDELRQQGESNDCSAIQYCLCVSVLFLYSKKMSLREMIKNFLTKNMQEIYPKKERVQFDIPYVEDIASPLMPFYLNISSSGLQFSDPLIYQAVLISHGKIHPVKVLNECNICDILLFLRPAKYKPLHDEMVLRVQYSHSHFVTRVTRSVMLSDSVADKIIKLITDFTDNYNDTDLLLSVIGNIKSDTTYTHKSRLNFFRHCSVYARKFFEDFNPELYAYCLAWEYVFVKIEQNENRLNELKNTVIACDSDVIGKFLHTSIDEFGNTLFHYFIIWNGEAEQTIICTLLTQSSKGELADTDIAKVWVSSKLENTTKRTPLDFAVFFGRYTFCLNCTSMKYITRSQEGWFKSAWGAITKTKEKENNVIQRLLQSGINNISDDVKDDIDMDVMFETDLIPSKSDIKFGDKCEFDHIKSILQ